jgi:hypothetical protein
MNNLPHKVLEPWHAYEHLEALVDAAVSSPLNTALLPSIRSRCDHLKYYKVIKINEHCYTVKTNFISTCEISEKAHYGKISFISHVLISFSDNSHEKFPAKNMKT